MTTKLFVNLPVNDLMKSIEFYANLGFSTNPQFTDKTAACIVIADDIYAMLPTHTKFKEFTSKEISDATRTTEVLTCLALESKDNESRRRYCPPLRRDRNTTGVGLRIYVRKEL